MCSRAQTPLRLAVRFAAAGNTLDAMVDVTGGPRADLPDTVATMRVDADRVEVFRARVARAKSIVYFGDNCGEIVFDRLLLEVIEAAAAVQVTFVTREVPVINDATITEALVVGLDAVADVVGNGIAEPLPGTDLSKVSERVRGLVEEADLVISKGGANYEMLDEEPALAGKTTFVLFGKCDPSVRIPRRRAGRLDRVQLLTRNRRGRGRRRGLWQAPAVFDTRDGRASGDVY